jgi:hypothetical protein
MTTTWGVLGSLLINLMLGLVIAAVFSVAPSALAEACSGSHPAATHSKSTAAPKAPATPATSGNHGYLISVRMGWAI